MPAEISHFHLPLYREIPNVGLYLEQIVKYINECLRPLGCIEVTPSMISNYVKKGYVASPVKKQYDSAQIANLIFIAVAKQVLSMENIAKLLSLQRAHYDTGKAYDHFCRELEAMLRVTFGLDGSLEELPSDAPEEQKILRAVLVAAAHVIYLSHCFEQLERTEQEAEADNGSE